MLATASPSASLARLEEQMREEEQTRAHNASTTGRTVRRQPVRAKITRSLPIQGVVAHGSVVHPGQVLVDKPVQRIGLSATQRPLDEIARFLGGRHHEDGVSTWRNVEVIDARAPANMDIEVIVPVEDMPFMAEPVSRLA